MAMVKSMGFRPSLHRRGRVVLACAITLLLQWHVSGQETVDRPSAESVQPSAASPKATVSDPKEKPLPLVPDRSEEVDWWGERPMQPTPEPLLTFFAERFQRNLHYGKNEPLTDPMSLLPKQMVVDWVDFVNRNGDMVRRYLLNGVDLGSGKEGVDRLCNEIGTAEKGTWVLFPSHRVEYDWVHCSDTDGKTWMEAVATSDVPLEQLAGSPKVAKLLAVKFRKGQLERHKGSVDDMRLGIGKVMWPGQLEKLPDIVLTWTLLEDDAVPPGELSSSTKYYLNGRDMGTEQAGFDNVLRELAKFPKKSHMMIYPFYGVKSWPRGPFVNRDITVDTGHHILYHKKLSELREVLLERELELTLIATPVRDFTTEVDRWLLEGGKSWNLTNVVPLAVDLGSCFYVNLLAEGTLWMPDVYPPVMPLTARSGAIPTPPNWIRYKPERGKLKVFHQEGVAYYAMRPEYCLSGAEGIESISVNLGGDETKEYTVCLYFCDPNKDAMPNERVFSVSLQGKEVLTDFDIVAEAGNPFRPIVKKFSNIAIEDRLEIGFRAQEGESVLCAFKIMTGDPPEVDVRSLNFRARDPSVRSRRNYSGPRR